MSIIHSVRAYLASKATITALVSTRITTTHRDQGKTLPAITIHRVSGGHEHDLEGSAGSAIPRVQIDIWSDNDVQADTIAEAVRQVMQGYSGTMGSHSVGIVILDNEIDLYEEPTSGKPLGIYHIAQDYRIRHTEAIPNFS